MSYKWHSLRERPFDASPIHFPAIEQTPFKGATLNKAGDRVTKGRQITASLSHPRSPDGKRRSGGPFFTAYSKPGTPTRYAKLVDHAHTPPWYKYQGPIVQPIRFGQYYDCAQSQFEKDDSYLDPIGAEAINIVDPTNPNAQTGVALGEILMDRSISLPIVQSWKRRTEIIKAAGSEYLSAEFGWLPLLHDIKNTVQSIRDATTIMENYESLDGHEAHREFEFDPMKSDDVSPVGSPTHCYYNDGFGGNVPGFHGPQAQQSLHTEVTTRRWFSGTFTHYPHKVSDLAKRFGVGGPADKLFGISMTPDVLWELAPWSWAIDWFSDTGEVLSNFTSFEINGLIMKYGFIMEETSAHETLFMPGTGLTDAPGPPPNLVNATCIKRRRVANPFGFGIGWEDLSPTQLAITAALGITRLL